MSEQASGDDKPPGASEVIEENLAETEPAASTATTPVADSRIDTLSNTREHLAYWLLGLLTAVTVGAGITVVCAPQLQQSVEEFLKLVFTPLIGLVGSVIGFYFGSQASQK